MLGLRRGRGGWSAAAADDKVTFQYDRAGRIEQSTDRSDRTIQFQRDGRGLLSNRTHCGATCDAAASPVVDTLGYDGMGRLTSAARTYDRSPADFISAVTRRYDAFSNVISETQTIGTATPVTFSYEYGPNGNRKSADYAASGARIDYTYGVLDRVSTLSRYGTLLASYEYCLDPTCGGFYVPGAYPRKRTVYLGGGRSVQSQFGYDDHRRLNVIATSLVTPAGTQNIATFNSAFDDLGNRRTSQVSSATLFAEAATFQYDDLNRLTLANYTGPPTSVGDESFDLDSLGNRESYANARAGTPTLIYGPNDSTNRYSTINGLSVEHDADGNLTRSVAGHTLVYDHEHRLAQVDGEFIQFDYDALGRRIASKLATGTTYHYYDGQRIVAEYEATTATAAGTPTRSFVDGSLYVDEHLLLHENDRDYAYLLGPLYSVMGLVDDTGVVVESYHYDAYGAPAELPTSGQASAAGSRYLTITPPNYGSTPFAIHVAGDASDAETSCVDLYARKVCERGSQHRQDCATDADCPKTCEGGANPPQPCTSDSQCLPTSAGFKCLGACTSRGLGDGPVYLTSAAWGVVTVGHERIHPSTKYDVSFVFEAGGATSPIAMTARKWADVDGNGSVNVLDVAAEVDAIKKLSWAPPLSATDLWPCNPDVWPNVLDLASAVDAVKGKPFPCPPSCGTPRAHNPYRFTGRRLDWTILDSETGAIDMVLYDYRARSYDARLGRFLQPDPAGYVDGMNLYEAFKGNPSYWVDPLGTKNWRAYFDDRQRHGEFYAGFWDLMGSYDVDPTGEEFDDLIRRLQQRRQMITEVANGLGTGIEFVGAFNDGGDLALVVNEWREEGFHADQLAVLLPFIGKGHLKVMDKCGKVLKRLRGSSAAFLATVRPVRELRNLTRGIRRANGVEIHHLIETRFAPRLGIAHADDIEGVLAEQLFHRGAGQESITNLLRREIPYRANGDYRDVPLQKIYEAHKTVYESLGIPEVMEAINHWFEGLGATIGG